MLDASQHPGPESIVGGTGAYVVFGGAGSTVVGSANSNSGTTAQIVGALNMSIVLATAGNYTVASAQGDTITAAAGAANVQIGGAAGDLIDLTGNTGSATIIATAGNETVIGGSGNTTIYGGFGDSITAGAGGFTYVDGTAGGMRINIGSGGANLIIGSFAGGPDTITGGAATVQIQFLGDGDLVDFSGQTGAAEINALAAGNENLITLGSGPATVYAGAGDTVAMGSGAQYVDGSAGGVRIAVGSGGSGIIFGSTGGAPNTITGGAADVQIQFLGAGDLVNFSGQTGAAAINSTDAGNPNLIVLGTGAASVFGGVGDTISLGSGSQYVDGSAGGMTIKIGSGGIGVVDTIIGSAASSDTILGGTSSLSFNPQVGGSGDLLDLSGSTGNATINTFSSGGAELGISDTIMAGNGSDSVFAGGGDRIGVGNSTGAGGTHLFGHSTSVAGAAIGFGSNDTVVATSYDTVTGTATVDSTVLGASSAQVTIGGAAGDFDSLTDFVFYQNETASTDAAIVATSQSIDGGASSIITLPDGTVMTLLGVTQSELQTALTAGTLFKA